MKGCVLKVVILMFFSLMTAASYAQLTDLYIVAPAGETGEFALMQGPDQAISFYNVTDVNNNEFWDFGDITVGTSFKDVGHMVVDKLLTQSNIEVPDQNMGVDWELTITWVLKGTITSIEDGVVKGSYTSGEVYVYYDTSPDYDDGSSTSPSYYYSDDNNNDILDDTETLLTDSDSGYGFDPDTILLMKGVVVSGDGSAVYSPTADQPDRSVNVLLEVEEINDTYFNSRSLDLGSLVEMDLLIAVATESAPSGALKWIQAPTNRHLDYVDEGYGPLAVYGGGTATIEFTTVPEPATILLLGGGLFVIGIMGRKKIIK